MVVTCNSCKARFRVELEKIPDEGVRLRCAKCANVFTAMPDAGVTPKNEPTHPEVGAGKGAGADWFDDLADNSPGMPPANSPTPPPAASSVGPASAASFLEDVQNVAQTPPATGKAPVSVTPPPHREETKRTPRQPQTTPPAKDNSEAPPPPRRALIRAHPLVMTPIPWGQRVLRLLLIAAVLFSGIFLGLAAMGVTPTITNLRLLVTHGRRALPDGLHVIKYQGNVVEADPKQQVLFVDGEILNRLGRRIPGATLRLEVFSPNGEYLTRTAAHCCEEGISPNQISRFAMQVEVTTPVIGSYKVTVESADEGVSVEP